MCVSNWFYLLFSFLSLCYVGVFGLRVRCFSGFICISGVTFVQQGASDRLADYIVSRSLGLIKTLQ